MKYLKTYERVNKKPQIGDYVVITAGLTFSEELEEYIENNVGQIIMKSGQICNYLVKYDDPDRLIYFNEPEGSYWTSISHILFYSSNKEECEAFLSSKKYNL